jgi:putative PEP-CTERM system TPR-repeat lipoprotein
VKIKTGFSAGGAFLHPRLALAVIALGVSAWPHAGSAAITPMPKSTTVSADVADLMGKAQRALSQGHPEVALIYLKNAETVAPDVANVHLQLGQVLLAVNNAAEATRELNIAKQKGVPGSRVLPLIFQAMIAQHEGQMLLDTYPPPGPNDRSQLATDTLRARAVAQLQIGKRDDAVASLDRALAISRNAQNLTARAQLALDAGDSNLAGKLTDEALSKEPNNVGTLMLKISLLQKSGQAAKALGYADNLVKANHGRPLSLLARAGVYLQLKQDSKAAADIDASLSAAPNLAPAIFYKAVIRARAKDAKGAWALAQTLPRGFLSSRPDIGLATSQMAVQAGQHETGADILHETVQNFPGNVDARVRLAGLYLALKEPAEAQKTLDPVKNSSDPRINALIAQTFAIQKNFPQSLDYYQKASQEGYGGDNLKVQLASADIRQGKYDEAIHLLQPLTAKQPNRPEVVGPLVTAYLKKGNEDAALQIAQGLTKAAPNNPLGPFYEAQVAAQKSDFDSAIASATVAVKRNPKFAPGLFLRANMLAAKGEVAAAEADLQSIISINPKYTLAALRLADLVQQDGDDAKALDILKKTAAANPKDLFVYSTLERFYAARKRWTEASATLATFLHNVPNNGSALTLQAEIQLETGAVDAAIKDLTALLKSYPHSQDIAILLAQAYAQKGDKQAAHTILAKAIADEPRAPAAHIAIVANDLSQNNNMGAFNDATAFVQDAPGPAAAQTMASVLAKQNKLEDAEKVLRQSLNTSPDSHTAIQLSFVMRANGKIKPSNDLLQSWLAQHPKDLGVRQVYSTNLMATNKPLAEQQMRQILSIAPNNVGALNNLAWLLAERDPQQAYKLAQRALKISPNFSSVLDTNGWVAWQLKHGPTAMACSNGRARPLRRIRKLAITCPSSSPRRTGKRRPRKFSRRSWRVKVSSKIVIEPNN